MTNLKQPPGAPAIVAAAVVAATAVGTGLGGGWGSGIGQGLRGRRSFVLLGVVAPSAAASAALPAAALAAGLGGRRSAFDCRAGWCDQITDAAEQAHRHSSKSRVRVCEGAQALAGMEPGRRTRSGVRTVRNPTLWGPGDAVCCVIDTQYNKSCAPR